MHARPVDAEDRLRHETGVQPMACCHPPHGVLEGDRIVRAGQGIRIPEVDLVLTGGHLMVARFDLHPERLESQNDLTAHLLSFVTGREVKIAAHVMRHGPRGMVLVGLAIAPEKKELKLWADVVGVACLGGAGQHTLQDLARHVERRITLRPMDITDDPGPSALRSTPGKDPIGIDVRDQYQVALVDAGKPLYGGPVKPDPIPQRALQPPHGDGDTLDGSHHIRKLEAQELYSILLHARQKSVHH